MKNQDANFDILSLLDKGNDLDVLLGVGKDFETKDKDLSIIDDLNATNPEGKSDIIKKTLLNDLTSINNSKSGNVDILENIIRESEAGSTNKKSLLEKTVGGIIFLLKYLTTSILVFIILLGITNYGAYVEIAKSYLNPEALEKSRLSLLSSVNGVNIGTKTNPKNENNLGDKNILKNSIKKGTMGEKISTIKNKTYHSMDKLLASGYENKLNIQIEMVPYENRIVIPKIGKNVPLIEIKNKTVKNVKELEDIFMSELSKGVIRYPGSARPGEIGNSFIFGHSSNFPWVKGDYNNVFALLDNIVFGDEVIVYYNQKKFTYRIKEKKIIKPGDVSILKRNNKIAEITLMTCWPIGTTINRMMVIGELVK